MKVGEADADLPGHVSCLPLEHGTMLVQMVLQGAAFQQLHDKVVHNFLSANLVKFEAPRESFCSLALEGTYKPDEVRMIKTLGFQQSLKG
mmetsp:Transcript_90408/g.161070  ORF Transcript_90408/g.161070 Transcript_90408/m.161070 type:complete len:90 (-) Transcript_90408:274-543(-)